MDEAQILFHEALKMKTITKTRGALLQYFILIIFQRRGCRKMSY
jgi:hypothetical protein